MESLGIAGPPGAGRLQQRSAAAVAARIATCAMAPTPGNRCDHPPAGAAFTGLKDHHRRIRGRRRAPLLADPDRRAITPQRREAAEPPLPPAGRPTRDPRTRGYPNRRPWEPNCAAESRDVPGAASGAPRARRRSRDGPPTNPASVRFRWQRGGWAARIVEAALRAPWRIGWRRRTGAGSSRRVVCGPGRSVGLIRQPWTRPCGEGAGRPRFS